MFSAISNSSVPGHVTGVDRRGCAGFLQSGSRLRYAARTVQLQQVQQQLLHVRLLNNTSLTFFEKVRFKKVFFVLFCFKFSTSERT